ncbi:MAG: CBS domain-containing protein [Pseudomonadota bacterium]|nr:CBS domain-containing protein [Pseudomonadota bacterium]
MSQPIVRVKEVMKIEFDCIDGMTTVADALNTMKHKETKLLVVDKRDDNDEYGVVLINDIANQVLAKDRSPVRVNVYEIMTKPAISVHANMDIRYCARMFENVGVSRMPVTDNGKIVGVVSYTDLVLKGLCKSC